MEEGWNVYYELYIDVLFLVNFMMDYLLLLTTKKVLKCSATHLNICLGALTGALATCVIICLPIPYAFIKLIVFHTIVNTCMIKIGLRVKGISKFLKAFLLLYVSGILFGGVLTLVQQYVRIGSLFFAIAVAGYYLIQGIWWLILKIQNINQYNCQVLLFIDNKEYKLTALIDTGNRLTDPLTHQPVCLVERKAIEITSGQQQNHEMRYIAYQSVGCPGGMIPVMKFDKMCIHREEDYWVENPVIGLCENMLSAEEEYEMILNPDVF